MTTLLQFGKILYGEATIRSGQGNPPTLQAIDAGPNSVFYEHATSSNGTTDFYFSFHINHDYKLGSDIYFHVHHLNNNAGNNSATVAFTATATLAQLSYANENPYNPNSKFLSEGTGHGVTLATISHTYDADSVNRHVVSEVQLSSNGGSATTLDSSKINIDSMILIRLRRKQVRMVIVLEVTIYLLFNQICTIKLSELVRIENL